MALFEDILAAPLTGEGSQLDLDERLARRELVLDVMRNTITFWAGVALTIDEAEWMLLALPDLHAGEFKSMTPMGEA